MHKTVVRNQAYQTKSFTTVERHNERKNEEYFNGDVELELAKINVKISKPMLGGEESVTMFRKDWENVKKTALSQAHKEEQYRTAVSENDTLNHFMEV